MDAVEIKSDKEQNDLYRDKLIFLSLDIILIAILLTEIIVLSKSGKDKSAGFILIIVLLFLIFFSIVINCMKLK